MRKQGTAVAAAVLAISLGAFGAAAQGPAGVGGDQSPRNSGTSHSPNLAKWIMKKDKNGADDKPATAKAENAKATSTESTHARHSLNPVKWIRKDKKAGNDKPTTAEKAAPKVKTVKAKKAETDKRAAAKAEAMNTTKAESAHTHHSLNPIRWIKKAPDQAAQKSDKPKNKKSSAKPAKQDSPAPAPTA